MDDTEDICALQLVALELARYGPCCESGPRGCILEIMVRTWGVGNTLVSGGPSNLRAEAAKLLGSVWDDSGVGEFKCAVGGCSPAGKCQSVSWHGTIRTVLYYHKIVFVLVLPVLVPY